jgi:hypothetical protein
MMTIDERFDKEVAYLEEDLENGDITKEQFRRAYLDLVNDFYPNEEDYK